MEYNLFSRFACLVMLVHNSVACWYISMMVYMYWWMAARNMHAVEDSTIGQLYDKLQYHKITFKQKRFYYTRKAIWDNITEMMGCANPVRWFVIWPYTR
jgi:hypothetical protein